MNEADATVQLCVWFLCTYVVYLALRHTVGILMYTGILYLALASSETGSVFMRKLDFNKIL